MVALGKVSIPRCLLRRNTCSLRFLLACTLDPSVMGKNVMGKCKGSVPRLGSEASRTRGLRRGLKDTAKRREVK